MGLARSDGPSAPPPYRLESPRANPFLDDSIAGDGRSSSLSDIDDNKLDDDEAFVKVIKSTTENDSEAETERVDESPKHLRNTSNIVLSTTNFETSPSKLAQSTTYDDMSVENAGVSGSPSKPPICGRSNTESPDSRSNNNKEVNDRPEKKRKWSESAELSDTEHSEDEHHRKRRGSPARTPAGAASSRSVGSPFVKIGETQEDIIPMDEPREESKTSVLRGAKKGKKGKRKSRNAKTVHEDLEHASFAPTTENDVNGTDDHHEEDENHEETEDADTATKLEGEIRRKNCAMEVLMSLERQFATLRDKIYDDRIVNLFKEIAQLDEPKPTHPEYLRQRAIIENYRDHKVRHEDILFDLKLVALCNKSQADRSQIHSTYFQQVRDIRENVLDQLAALYYRIQQDRFQNTEASPDYSIAFPTRRSQQISQQAAYNKEISILSGVAKYVGFPSAPIITGARQQECDDDFEKMGI